MTLTDDICEHVRSLADRIRRGNPPSSLAGTMVEWVRLASRDTDTFQDAETVKRAFPGEFGGGK